MFRSTPAVVAADASATADAAYPNQISSSRIDNHTNQQRVIQSKNKSSNLSHLLYEKEYYTLSELEDLRKAIECQQQIQMALKHNNPERVQIQCRHFKSKKCTFQITFKQCDEIDSGVTTTSSTAIAKNGSADITHHSASIFSGISYDSSTVAISAQLPVTAPTALSQSDIKCNQNTTGRWEESFAVSDVPVVTSAGSVNLQVVYNQNGSNNNKKTINQKLQNDVTCSPSNNNIHVFGKNFSSMSSWQQSNPPATMLLQNFDASAATQMGEREKREVSIYNHNHHHHHNYYSDSLIGKSSTVLSSQTTDRQDTCQQFLVYHQRHGNHPQHMIAQDHESNDDCIVDEIYDANSQSHIPSSNISPFVLPEEDLTSSCIDSSSAMKTVVEQQACFTRQAARTQSTEVLFKMSTCKLLHRNHPVMSDEKYTIHLAKRWLEGHQEKIEKVYRQLRESKSGVIKITPKTIKKQLIEEYGIDIYEKCEDKEHKKYLKKKLDNLMKSIRLKEKTITAKNAPENLALTEQQPNKRGSALQTKQKKTKTMLIALTKDKTKEIKNIYDHAVSFASDMEQEVTTQLQDEYVTLSHVQGQIDQIRKDIQLNSNKENEEWRDNLKCYSSRMQFMAPPIPETTFTKEKVIKEEWESFLQLDVPQKRVEPAR